MTTRAALLSLLVLLSGVPALAADVRTLLPPNDPGDADVRIGTIAEYDAATLSNFIDGGAELFFDYGFVRAATADYGGGDAAVTCTVYEMKNAEAAFGVFSYFRGKPQDVLQLGDGGFASDLQVAFWQDRYFTTIETFSSGEQRRETLAAFARAISARIGTHATAPAVLDRLPSGALKGSERLLRGRVAANALVTAWPFARVALAGDAVLVSAQYLLNAANATLWLVPFEERATLERVWTTSMAKATSDGACRATQNTSSTRGDDELLCAANGVVTLARRVGSTLVVVSGASSPEDASLLIGRVRP